MRFIVQVRIEPDTHTTSDVIDIAVIERDVLSPATLGLSIEEAKGLLAGVQTVVATEHCADALSNVEHCEDCGRRFAHKETRHLQVRSLYGVVTVPNPRWWTCICNSADRTTFTPLAALLLSPTGPGALLTGVMSSVAVLDADRVVPSDAV